MRPSTLKPKFTAAKRGGISWGKGSFTGNLKNSQTCFYRNCLKTVDRNKQLKQKIVDNNISPFLYFEYFDAVTEKARLAWQWVV